MRWQRLLVGLIVFAYLSTGILAAEAPTAKGPTWKVGLRRLKITPTTPLWMSGYGGRDHPAEGTLHDIWVKILVLEDARGRRGVVITSDVCGWSKVSYDTLCTELQKRCALTRSQVMLTYSHTHTGPALRECLRDYFPMDDKQRALNDAYTVELEKRIVAAAAAALARMEPATLWASEGSAGFAVNRRDNKESEVPELLKQGTPLKGPVDHDIPTLVVRSPGGDLKAVVFGYACHTTTLGIYQWSGDFAGFAQIDLEKNHPDCQAMYYMGCGADQNPLPRRTVELCRKYGKMLSTGVEEALRKPMRPVRPELRTAFEFVDLPYEKTMTRAELETRVSKGGLYGRWAKRMLGQLDSGKTFEKSFPYAVQVWRLGADQLWISLGGEVVVDYSLKFKQQYGPTTWTHGFCHDLTAYMPSRRVWDEGGYEGGYLGEYGLPAMRWAPDVEDRITAAVDRLVKKVK